MATLAKALSLFPLGSGHIGCCNNDLLIFIDDTMRLSFWRDPLTASGFQGVQFSLLWIGQLSIVEQSAQNRIKPCFGYGGIANNKVCTKER